MFKEVRRYTNLTMAVLMIVISLGRVDAQQNLTGLVVEEAPTDSPAAKAGLKVGDRILSYDEKALASPAALQAAEENTFGKKEVSLRVRRAEQIETLTAAPGKLGIKARPELPGPALQLYEEGKSALQAQRLREAIDRWEAAAKAAQVLVERAAAAWLRGRIGEVYEGQRQWPEVFEAHMAAWEILKQSSDAAAQSRALVALGRASQNRNELEAADGWFEQARKVDLEAGNEMWVADDLNSLGNMATTRGKLQAAQDYHSRALAIRERLVPNSLNVAASLNNLGNVAHNRGDLKAAQDYHSRALAIRERIAPNSPYVASSLNNLGVVARGRGDLQAAQEYYSRALAIKERLVPNSLDVAASLNNLGTAIHDRGDLKAAQDYYSRALAIYERLAPNSLDVALSLNNLGSVARNRGDLQAAQDYHSRALVIYERLVPNSLQVAISLNNLGNVVRDRGDLQAAQDYYSRALEIRERLAPNSMGVAGSLNNLGLVTYDRGDLQAAQEYYSRALAIHERLAPDSLEVAASLNNIGNVARNRGDLQAAQDYHGRALAIKERLAPNSLDVAASLNNLGLIACDRGDLKAAQDYYSRALAIREQLAPNSLDVAASLNNLGNVAHDRGDLQVAQDYHGRALAIKERLAPHSLDVAISLNNLGAIVQDRGDLHAAQDYHSQALAIKERLAPNSLQVAISLNNLGSVYRNRGDLQAAQDYYSRALAIRERLAPNSLSVASSLTELGALAFRAQRFSDARSLFARAITIVEAQRSSIPSTESRGLFLAQHRESYLGLLRTHLAINDLPAAFATFERARARSLVDLLAERRLDFRANAPADLLKQQNQLDQNRSAAYAALAKLNSEKDGKRIAELQDELTRYSIQQRELEAEFRRASPRFANLRYPEPLDLPIAQATLDEGMLLLAYYVAEKQTYLFAVTKTGLKLITLPITEAELKKQVAAFYEEVAVLPRRRPMTTARQAGQNLYTTLISPARELVDQAKRILICPDGPLQTLPFAALVSRSKPQPRYFIEEKPLHMIISMTVYAETRKQARPNGEQGLRLLAIGDAVYTQEQAEILHKRGELKIEKRAEPEVDSEVSEARRRDLRFLVPLPGSRREVEEIARLFGKAVTIKLNKAATETTIRQESRDYSIIHLAVHGWLDDRSGLNSGLALSRPELLGRKPTRDDNGLLQAWEILEQVKLQADLVVLSACETGLGEELRGEGLIGLTRAFQYAGARSVVASLWGAADESTTFFMSAFYRELRKGRSKDQALRQAMAATRRNPQWRHPYYWAPFILVGSWN